MHPRVARRDDTFLWVIDLQEPVLRLMPNRDRLLERTRLLLEAARVLSLPIVATEQYPERFGPTDETVRAAWGDTAAVGKTTFTGCCDEAMADRIRRIGRKTALLCGVEAHVCVQQTAHDLLDSGFTVHVAADAVDSRSSLDGELGLAKMRDSGVVVTSAEMVVFELLGRAGTPEFKELLPLLR